MKILVLIMPLLLMQVNTPSSGDIPQPDPDSGLAFGKPLASIRPAEDLTVEVRYLFVNMADDIFMPNGNFHVITRFRQGPFPLDSSYEEWAEIEFSQNGHTVDLFLHDVEGDGGDEIALRYHTGANLTVLEFLKISGHDLVRNENWTFASNLGQIDILEDGCIMTRNQPYVPAESKPYILEETWCLKEGSFLLTEEQKH